MRGKKNLEKVENAATPSKPKSEELIEETPIQDEREVEEEPVEPEAPGEPEILVEQVPEQPAIPANTLVYLKRHPEMKSVYIDCLGGTYPGDINPIFVKDATLYQNPYFQYSKS